MLKTVALPSVHPQLTSSCSQLRNSYSVPGPCLSLKRSTNLKGNVNGHSPEASVSLHLNTRALNSAKFLPAKMPRDF